MTLTSPVATSPWPPVFLPTHDWTWGRVRSLHANFLHHYITAVAPTPHSVQPRAAGLRQTLRPQRTAESTRGRCIIHDLAYVWPSPRGQQSETHSLLCKQRRMPDGVVSSAAYRTNLVFHFYLLQNTYIYIFLNMFRKNCTWTHWNQGFTYCVFLG